MSAAVSVTAALDRSERRLFARVPLANHWDEVSLGERRSDRPAARVLDFSPGGVSLAPESAAFFRSTEASLRLASGEIPCSLDPEALQRIHAGGSGAGGRVGVALHFDPEAQARVASAYHHLRFPSLGRRSDVAASEVQRLFADSGYLALKSELVPDGTWLRAEWPSTLSHEAIFRQHDGRLIGHIAITRAYKNAWLGHEIATLRDSAESARCRRDLYQHFCVWPRLLDGEGTHVFGYYNPQRRFHRRMFEAFAQGSSSDDCVAMRMERYMPEAASLAGEPADLDAAALSVTPLQPADEHAVLLLLESAWPELVRTAFDIGPGELSQRALHPGFAAAGVERGRECLVLRAGEQLVAVLLCEWDDSRLSLFDVLSVAHVFLGAGVTSTPGLERAISSVVRNFYRARGARVPLLTCPPGTFQRRDLPGFRWAETMGCIVFSARALRAFEAYVELSLDPDTRPDEGHVIALGK